MLLFHSDPQEVAGKYEAGDLPPSVGQQLRQAQQTTGQAVDVRGLVGFKHHRLAGVVTHGRRAFLERAQRGGLKHAAHRELANRAVETWMIMFQFRKGCCSGRHASARPRSNFADVRQIKDLPPTRWNKQIHGNQCVL